MQPVWVTKPWPNPAAQTGPEIVPHPMAAGEPSTTDPRVPNIPQMEVQRTYGPRAEVGLLQPGH